MLVYFYLNFKKNVFVGFFDSYSKMKIYKSGLDWYVSMIKF